jgi:hypothetical protein
VAAAPPRAVATPPPAAVARPRQPKLGGYHPAAAGMPVREFLPGPWGRSLSHPYRTATGG